MELGLLNDLVVIFGLSVAIILIFNKLKIPAVVGFLLSGIMAGPSGLKLISSIHEVEELAEIGILLLLFTIGIEFSFKEIFKLRKSLTIGGASQVILTTISIAILVNPFMDTFKEAIFVGFIVALSSTALVIKLLSEKGEIDTLHGRTVLAVLISQDLITIPMILFVPYFAGININNGFSIPLLLGKGILIIAMVYIAAKYIVPFMLFQIARTRVRELFLINILVICFGIIWITSSLGISIALGAFIAGLIISESEFSQQALGNILPFRDIFISLFFISIGMLLNVNYALNNIIIIIGLTFLVLIIKTFWGVLSSLLLKHPLRTGIIVGISINAIGEFAFVMAKEAKKFNILNESNYQLFLSVSILTIGISPFLIRYSSKIAALFAAKKGKDKVLEIKNKSILKDHLIIVGYGINGKNLSKAAIESKISYVVLELNPETVSKERKKGIPIYYGDAANEGVLRNLSIENARVMVVAINDPYAIRRIVSMAKNINPAIHLIVRTRHISEINSLLNMGADEVVPEEYETSIEIFTRVMLKYLVPFEDIEKLTDEIRANGYKLFRAIPSKRKKRVIDIPEISISAIKIHKNSPIIGKSLREIDFRNKYNTAILFVRKPNKVISNIKGEYIICDGDILYIMIEPIKVNELRKVLNEKSN